MKRREFFAKLGRFTAAAAASPLVVPKIAAALAAPSLNMNAMFTSAMKLRQMRQSDEIDILTDRHTANLLQRAMTDYYKNAYARR